MRSKPNNEVERLEFELQVNNSDRLDEGGDESRTT